jgi:hypothetical protein
MAAGNKSFLHLTTSVSQVLSLNSGAILGTVVVNTAPTGTGGTLLIYDDQSAVTAHLIASISMVGFAANVPGWTYNAISSRGLFIVWTQGGTVVGDLTITYQ